MGYKRFSRGLLNKTGCIIGALASLFVAGAAVADKADDVSTVRELSTQRLDALLAGDFERAYHFTSPLYRQFASLDEHMQRIHGAKFWKAATVGAVSCEGKRCEIKVKLDYIMASNGQMSQTVLDEVWIEKNGKWWIYYSLR